MNDCIALKSRYNAPLFVVGDFNSRTGVIDDFIEGSGIHNNEGFDTSCNLFRDVSSTKDDLDCLGICIDRHNMDTCTNNNGHRLIDLCRCTDIRLVNGRFGIDRKVGRFTYHYQSTIDYAIASPELMMGINNFYVNSLHKHSPICIVFKTNKLSHFQSDDSASGSCSSGSCILQGLFALKTLFGIIMITPLLQILSMMYPITSITLTRVISLSRLLIT